MRQINKKRDRENDNRICIQKRSFQQTDRQKQQHVNHKNDENKKDVK